MRQTANAHAISAEVGGGPPDFTACVSQRLILVFAKTCSGVCSPLKARVSLHATTLPKMPTNQST